jgi:tRNA1Val (adenine37-N6)-methyltransferase
MANSYFHFKQFTVQQEHCAMKVCTDACLFGSLLPTSSGGGGTIKHVLDIGAGTGLLSLMYAQKNNDAVIDAVEIDETAAMQAKQNFEASPWKERLEVHNCSIQEFQFHQNQSTDGLINLSTNQQYNLIISNPPFFDNDLKSNDNKRNLALHSAELSLELLVDNIKRLLKEDGSFAVLLPYHRSNYFEQLAIERNYFLLEKVLVKQTPRHSYFRSMLLFGRSKTIATQKEIIIRKDDGHYTAEFIELLKDYYLYL